MDPRGAKQKPSLNAVLADYFRKLDQGVSVDREAIIEEHPELAGDLRAYFDQEQRLWSAAEPVETAPTSKMSTRGRVLRIRCPHCHSPQELPADSQLSDLSCAACGSHFSLIENPQSTRSADSLTSMGRFELVERLGIGAFGSVWKARDKELDRTVAVKIPRRADMDANDMEKFLREARAAAQLRHVNIVSVHEVGREADTVYIVSDFVRGITLGDWLTGQQPSCREAAEVCTKIADALHHAHQQGVIHRDLKPANVMIDGDGEPYLMDFGLARREVGEVTVTLDGQVVGTPAYMSPEQAQGESHSADRRSDVYSVGVILFQMITGELPFRGNVRMIMHQVIHDEPPSPNKLNATVPKDLATIALKCLEKKADRRYATASDLAKDLRSFLSGEPIVARPVSRVEHAWRWCKRNPAVASLASAVIVVLLAIAIVAPIIAAREASLRAAAESRATEAKINRLDGLWLPVYLLYGHSRSDNPTAETAKVVLPAYQYELARILANLANLESESRHVADSGTQAAEQADETLQQSGFEEYIYPNLLTETRALKTRLQISKLQREGDVEAAVEALANERNMLLHDWLKTMALNTSGRVGGSNAQLHLTTAQFAVSHAKLLAAVEGHQDEFQDIVDLPPGLKPESFQANTPAQAYQYALEELRKLIDEKPDQTRADDGVP